VLAFSILIPLPIAASSDAQQGSLRTPTRDFRLADFQSRLTGVPHMEGEVRSFEHGVSLRDRKRDARGFGIQLGSVDAAGETDLEGIYRSHRYPAWGMPSTQGFSNEIWGGSLRTEVADGLRVQSEYAVSHKGHPALQRTPADVTGQAYLLDAQYSTTLASWADQPLVWQASLNRRRAEHSFWSPPSGAAIPGKRLDQVSSRLGWGDLSTSLQYQHARNLRRDGSPADGIRTNELDLSLAYSVGLPSLLTDLQPLLGERLKLSITQGRGTWFNPVTDERHRSRRMAMEASFTPGRSSWRLRHSRMMRRDRDSDTTIGSQSSTALLMTIALASEMTLTPGIEWIESSDVDHAYDTIIGTLSGAAGLIPGVLNTRLQLRAQQRSRSDRVDNCVDVHAKNEYDWIVRRAGRATPRVSLSMGGNYHYSEQSLGCSGADERYAAFAGLEMRWSAE
jgi:hypothetical protein